MRFYFYLFKISNIRSRCYNCWLVPRTWNIDKLRFVYN